MKRPVGVILTVVAQVLGSLVVLLASVGMLFMPAIMHNTPRPTPPSPMEPQFFYIAAAMYGFFAVLGFLTAIGMFRVQNWARYSTLVFAGLLVAMGLTTALVFVLMPIPDLPAKADSVPPGAMTPVVRMVMAAFPLGLAALGAAWLYYFNRASTKLCFTRADTASDVDAKGVLIGGKRVPLSIFVIAVLNLAGGIFAIPFAAWVPANLFFGFLVTGTAAKAITLLIGVLGVYVGIALLRLSSSGRRLAIAVNCLWLLNSVILCFAPNRMQQYFALYDQSLGTPTPYATHPESMIPFMRISMSIGIAVIAVILYFLVARASAFRTEAAPVDSRVT